MLGYGNFFFNYLIDTRETGPLLQRLSKPRQQGVLAFSESFDIAIPQIADVAAEAQSYRILLREVTIADSLNSAANPILAGRFHLDYRKFGACKSSS